MKWPARVLVGSMFSLAACRHDEATFDGSSHGETRASSTVTTSVAPTGSVLMTPIASPPGQGPHGSEVPLIELVHAPADTSVLSTIRAERLRATKDGRTLLVVVGASWCPPCKELHARLAKNLERAPIRLLEFDVDESEEGLKAAGYVSQSIPLVAKPRVDGRPDVMKEVPSRSREGVEALLREIRNLAAP